MRSHTIVHNWDSIWVSNNIEVFTSPLSPLFSPLCSPFPSLLTAPLSPLLSPPSPLHQATLETVTVSEVSGGGIGRRRARINTKLLSQGSGSFEETVDTTKDSFFDRNFPGETEVPWFKFQQAFLSNYETQLTGMV